MAITTGNVSDIVLFPVEHEPNPIFDNYLPIGHQVDVLCRIIADLESRIKSLEARCESLEKGSNST